MKRTDIAILRMVNQQIRATKFTTPQELVSWMGVIQAQDFGMAKWAIGVRVGSTTDQDIEMAINKGEILRTHILRPTWHFVSANDVHWMLDLSSNKIKAAMKSRYRELGLSEEMISKSNTIIVKMLSGGNHLPRETLIDALNANEIATNKNRASHLLVRAELDGLICSGTIQNGKQTYALLEERVPNSAALRKDEALVKLADRYFASHGPATLQDFTWWSGLSMSDARQAFEMVKAGFISETIDSQIYLFSNDVEFAKEDKKIAHLLPSYDEFLISYKDRSAALSAENFIKTVSNNGIFHPIIVVNGQVIGTWKRTVTKDHVIVETNFFSKPDPIIMRSVEEACIKYGLYLEKKNSSIISLNPPVQSS